MWRRQGDGAAALQRSDPGGLRGGIVLVEAEVEVEVEAEVEVEVSE